MHRTREDLAGFGESGAAPFIRRQSPLIPLWREAVEQITIKWISHPRPVLRIVTSTRGVAALLRGKPDRFSMCGAVLLDRKSPRKAGSNPQQCGVGNRDNSHLLQ
jgi:hypothetical protein